MHETSKHAPWALPMTDEWADAIDRFIAYRVSAGQPPTSLSAYRGHLGHLARRCQSQPLDVTADEIVEYAAAQTWVAETRRNRRQTIQNFFGWLRLSGQRSDDPSELLPSVKTVEQPPRPAPDAVYEAALAAAPPRERIMLRLGAELGMRRDEVCQVHPRRDLVRDVDGYSLRVHGKGDRDRVMPLPDDLAALLRAADPGYLFPGGAGGHLSARWVGKLMTELMPDEWTFHTLRHRFGTRAYRLTRDLLEVQELLGHTNPNTTKRYIQSDRARLRRTITDLAG